MTVHFSFFFKFIVDLIMNFSLLSNSNYKTLPEEKNNNSYANVSTGTTLSNNVVEMLTSDFFLNVNFFTM